MVKIGEKRAFARQLCRTAGVFINSKEIIMMSPDYCIKLDGRSYMFVKLIIEVSLILKEVQ